MIEDIRYLIIFAKIAEFGSISKAAKALGLSSATLSQHLHKLEKNLACALFYRNTRNMTLTHDGERLLETAKSILGLYEAGISEFKQRSLITKQKLHISIPAVFIHGQFMQHVMAFAEQHVDLNLQITCDDQRSDIIEENIDVAFRIGELPNSAFKAKYLFALPRRIVATQKFLDQYPPIQHPHDLQQMRWIGLSMRPNSRRLQHDRTGEDVEICYQPQVYVNNVEASYALVKLHAGLAAPPDELTQADRQTGQVVEVLPEWRLPPLSVYAVWHANAPISGIAYALIQHLYRIFNPSID